jgi:hypothetical protein
MYARVSWWSADGMAKIYPEKYVGKEGAEKRIFEKLRGLNSTQWTFFHSVDIARHSEKRSGEIDFIAVSRTALFTLEVKGGRISRRSGVWDANGHEMEESPVKQALQNYHAFDKYLKRSKLPRLPGGHCCVWPDVAFETTTGEWEITCIIDKGGSEMLFDSLQKAENHFRDEATRLGRPTPTLSEVEYQRLCGAILPDVIETTPPSKAINLDKAELIRLSESQIGVLDRIEDNPRMVISGPAGSGKTILAYEACKRLLRTHPNWKGAYACQSYFLAKDIQLRAWKDGLDDRFTVLSEETMMAFFLKNAHGVDFDSDLIRGKNLTCNLPGYQTSPDKNKDVNSSQLLDFLVVDEGQDVRRNILLTTLLNACTKRGLKECRLMWFEDTDQSIAEKLATGTRLNAYVDFVDGDPVSNCFKYKLDPINHRNPKPISDRSARLIGVKTTSGFTGSIENAIQLHETPSPIEALSGIIMELTRKSICDSDIVVVSVSGKSIDQLRGILVGSKRLVYEPELYDKDSGYCLQPDQIRWSRLIDIKGREFPVVILVDLPDFNDPFDKYLAYVAMTRANSMLIGVGSESQLKFLK